MFSKNSLNFLTRLLLGVDQFGSTFQFSIQEESKTYRTIIGGIASIAIYILGLIFFLYLVAIFLNNSIPPNIYQVSQFITQDFTYTIKGPTIAFGFPTNSIYNDNPNTIFFIPKITNYYEQNKISDQEVVQKGGKCTGIFEKSDFSQYYCVDCKKYSQSKKETYTIGKLPSQPGQQPYISVDWLQCQDRYLRPGQKCATDVEIQQFWSQGMIHIVIFLNEFDYNQEMVKQVAKEYFLLPHIFQANRFSLQISDIKVDKNIIFQDFVSYETVTNVENQYMLYSPESLKYFFPDDIVLNKFWIDLQPTKVLMSVQFKKFASLLAEFQSLFSILLLIGYAIQFYAQVTSEQNLIASIIKRFYPGIQPQEILQILNDKNHFLRQREIIKKLNIQEILEDLVELRLILNLLLTQSQFSSQKQIGLAVELNPAQKKKEEPRPLTYNKIQPEKLNVRLKESPELERNVIEILAIKENKEDIQFINGKHTKNYLNYLYSNYIPLDNKGVNVWEEMHDELDSQFNLRFSRSLINGSISISPIQQNDPL